MKKIVFRADAKVSIGTGDLVSLIHLSEYFTRRGWQAHFMIKGYDLGVALVKKHSLKRVSVIDPDSSIKEETDAINAYIKQNDIDAAFFEITERKLTDYDGAACDAIKACVSFDGIVPSGFDLIVNWDVYSQKLFSGRDYHGARLLLGPQYVILPSNFDRGIIAKRMYRKTVKDILITFGGADEFDLTRKAVEALALLGEDLKLEIVLGSGYKEVKGLKRALSSSGLKYRVRQNIKNMFVEYMGCDMAIGAGGLTAYEMVCTGTPALLTAVCEHQVPRCEYFDKKGYAGYMGFRVIDERMVREALSHRNTAMRAIYPNTDHIVETVDELYKRHYD